MAKAIYKYGPVVGVWEPCIIYGEPVKVDFVDGYFYCWCIVDPADMGPSSRVSIAATGQLYDGKYIDTVVLHDKGLVFHLIQEVKGYEWSV